MLSVLEMTAGHGDIRFVSYLMENHMGQGARTARILPMLCGLQSWLGASTPFLWFP
jgi:hypothetical protein